MRMNGSLTLQRRIYIILSVWLIETQRALVASFLSEPNTNPAIWATNMVSDDGVSISQLASVLLEA